jgi:putative Holliday junction resolvase
MNSENRRILAVDPGEKRIGIAVSDVTGTIANPYSIIKHTARNVDAALVVQVANELNTVRIIVGHPLGADGEVGPAARRAERFAQALQDQTELPIELWDEFGSTQEARSARIAMGVSRRKRKGHLDDLAATVILQTYLDFIASHRFSTNSEENHNAN